VDSSPTLPRFVIADLLLKGLRLRLERSRKHLDELKSRIKSLRSNDLNIVAFEEDLTAAYLKFELPIPAFFDPMVGILVGETIQNLRSSLDYLVYALAWTDSGSFPGKDSVSYR
jgi:hypothetical protein